MQLVAVRVPDGSDPIATVEPLLERLAEGGDVGVIRVGDAAGRAPPDGVDRLAEVEPAGGRLAEVVEVHDEDPLDSAIERLADAGVAYAVVLGLDDDPLPWIGVGERGGEGAIAVVDPGDLREAATLDALVETIDDLEPVETLASLVAEVGAHPDAPRAGAVATFTGRVRAENIEGHTTTHLEYERYDPVAEEVLAAIRDDLLERDGVYEVRMHHETGAVAAGEDAVHVVVLAGHREEAFAAVSDGIDRLKERVPIFKKEVTESGEFWAHDRP